MDPLSKEMERRRKEIGKEIELLFRANMKITDWDIPEPDDRQAADILLQIMREELEKIQKDINEGKYDNY
jgi:hypothetical protein